ncbi:Aspartic peptidase domain containing protein [Rhypophila decipiens]
MVGVVKLVQLTLWASVVNAFYPFFPDECDDSSCKLGSKRGVDSSQPQTVNGVVTLELHQRADESVAEINARAARSASQLAAKYAQALAPLASRTEPKLQARSNTWSVVSPAEPTFKSTAGVWQDGTDTSYFVQVKFGTPGKPLYMLLDSGAGTSWVMGTECKSRACLMHDTYGPTDSTTLKVNNSEPFNVDYGSGSVKGFNGHDTVQLAGLQTNYKFGLATETSKDFTRFAFDGILGLARSQGESDNFMAIMTEQYLIPSNLFAVSLSRHLEVTNAGSVTFGGLDPTKYVGEISYTGTAKDDLAWKIPMDDMGYGDQKAGIKGRFSHIDTGTSYAFGPKGDVAALHKLIPGAQSSNGEAYAVPCNSAMDITVTFSGVTYKIPPKDWVSRSSGGFCQSNIYGVEVIPGAWLLGDVFLKNVYTVFDADYSRVGFANKPVAPEVTKTATPVPTSTTVQVITTVVDGATITIAPSVPSPLSPAGQSGQNGGSGTAVPESSGWPTSSASSPGDQLESNKFVSIMCIVAVVVMMA